MNSFGHLFGTIVLLSGPSLWLGAQEPAKKAVGKCCDVFVTDTGKPNEPLLGWITDVIIAASGPA